MGYEKFCYDGSRKFDAKKFDTAATPGAKNKQEGQKRLADNRPKLEALQEKLYADGSKGLLVVFQAMDAGGKDGTINHVFSGANPEGVTVANFKTPCNAELDHDYLWRIHAEVPPRGSIGIFNRSHYEEVLIGKVLNLPKSQNLPSEARKDIWEKRYRHIREFEEYLTDNGIMVLKFFLHISKEEQRQRLLARLDDPAKNWKFETGDLETRTRWNDYMNAYTDMVNNTATEKAPWHVVPADKKWYARMMVSDVVVETLKGMQPAFPRVGKVKLQELAACREMLEDGPSPQENAAENTESEPE